MDSCIPRDFQVFLWLCVGQSPAPKLRTRYSYNKSIPIGTSAGFLYSYRSPSIPMVVHYAISSSEVTDKIFLWDIPIETSAGFLLAILSRTFLWLCADDLRPRCYGQGSPMKVFLSKSWLGFFLCCCCCCCCCSSRGYLSGYSNMGAAATSVPHFSRKQRVSPVHQSAKPWPLAKHLWLAKHWE